MRHQQSTIWISLSQSSVPLGRWCCYMALMYITGERDLVAGMQLEATFAVGSCVGGAYGGHVMECITMMVHHCNACSSQGCCVPQWCALRPHFLSQPFPACVTACAAVLRTPPQFPATPGRCTWWSQPLASAGCQTTGHSGQQTTPGSRSTMRAAAERFVELVLQWS